jgi:hypothetical protein
MRPLLLILLLAMAPPGNAAVSYSRDVEPVLRKHCLACHGARQKMSGLRLDAKEHALRGGYRGPAIQPRDGAASLLVRMVSTGIDGKTMPPGARLSEKEVDLLRRWIDEGAQWEGAAAAASQPAARPAHWAFQPLRKPTPPAVRNEAWVRNAIDRFVLARLEKEGIAPSPEADRATLTRRLHLDLTGLAPPAGTAREPSLDELFASPHYGERWALPWLDLAHYGDSDGHEQDHPRPHAWRYRDWVIGALNRNMPFDRFTIEQLAGDLLPDASGDQLAATGFLRCTLTSREGGIDPALVRDEQVADRTITTATVWLGLTFGCARCHDHKYDPVTQSDFYRLYAVFNGAKEANLDRPLPGEMEAYNRTRPEYERQRAGIAGPEAGRLMPVFERRLREAMENPQQDSVWRIVYEAYRVWIDDADAILRTPPAERTEKQRHALTRFLVKSRPQVLFDEVGLRDDPFRGALARLEELDERYPTPSELPVMSEDPRPPRTHVLLRGDYKSPGIEVQPGLPAWITPAPADGANRLTLARWLVSDANPLTARVTVNRIWQELFGTGLVATPEDFGSRGERPSHPELLDWLAAEFVASGWDVKRVQRLIVESAAYRQASTTRPELRERDPSNRLLARQSRLRLRAELIRDNALAAAGLLNPAVGGKSVRPPLPAGTMKLAFRGRWVESTGADRYRRGLYVHLQRTALYPQLTAFDTPDRLTSCARRAVSTNALQALTLLNDPVFFEASQALAARISREANGTLDDRIRYAFQLCLGREPDRQEAARVQRYYRDGKDGTAAWTGIANALLNLDEFITRE